ncbi:unnamed protein product [Fusarium graminearum]|uniref:Uncharacterized protein n=1 Tax=Gibberella zeae TaxID=5518 RepID=A0A4E9D9Q4_GIBZA|nr:unnamed protein product [Fusarium graminearum]CAG1980560.1 unnamed protein product [Fusarium graminearum]
MYQTKWNVNGLLGNDGTVRLMNQTKGHGFHSTGTPCSRLLSLVRPVHRLLRAISCTEPLRRNNGCNILRHRRIYLTCIHFGPILPDYSSLFKRISSDDWVNATMNLARQCRAANMNRDPT